MGYICIYASLKVQETIYISSIFLKKYSPLECVRCLSLSSPKPTRVPKMLKKCLVNTSTGEAILNAIELMGKK